MRPLISVLELRSVRGTGGGPEKTILLGTERRDRTRFAVTVCYIRDQRDDVFSLDARAASMDVDYVEVRERHSFDRQIWSALSALVAERRIDIVHAHDYKTVLLAMLLARRTGVIPMATAHGWTGQSVRERVLYYPLAKYLMARLPGTVAVSSDLKADLVRHGGDPARIRVLLNAIDPDAFRRMADRRDGVRRALGLASTDVVIGAVGRLEPQKRFDRLLTAIASLSTSSPDVRVALVGDGSLRADLTRTAADLGIGSLCLFLGHRTDVADLHHAFDLFVQASDYEGTPNAVLEAMAMETPLVATDVGGTRELVTSGVHGLVVPTNDTPALAAAIESVLRDPHSARIRALAARHRVESDFSFDARTRRLESLYEELMRVRDRSGGVVPSPVRVPDA